MGLEMRHTKFDSGEIQDPAHTVKRMRVGTRQNTHQHLLLNSSEATNAGSGSQGSKLSTMSLHPSLTLIPLYFILCLFLFGPVHPSAHLQLKNTGDYTLTHLCGHLITK